MLEKMERIFWTERVSNPAAPQSKTINKKNSIMTQENHIDNERRARRAMSAATVVMAGAVIDEAYDKLEAWRAGVVGMPGTTWSVEMVHHLQATLYDMRAALQANYDAETARLADDAETARLADDAGEGDQA